MIVYALQKEFVPGTNSKKIMFLGKEYLEQTTEEELNETIKTSLNNYVDSDEYKNKQDYVKTIYKKENN